MLCEDLEFCYFLYDLTLAEFRNNTVKEMLGKAWQEKFNSSGLYSDGLGRGFSQNSSWFPLPVLPKSAL